jgi:hypothetical protein
MTVSVLNGSVKVGDRIAYGSRGGARIGVVTEIRSFRVPAYRGDARVQEKIKVSVVTFSGYGLFKYPLWLTNLDRVIKL